MASGEASSNHGRPVQETQGVQGQRPNGHVMPSPLETWKNVLAYVAVFAFVVMATYYGEQGACAWAGRRKPR
ncbi:hypothetical protein U14_04695 [Candidatus Moduliflexus flocculans]|uniref:Uncharacterized protein n=1 Tax=Candidatus Moduliflexus flocculans TaxID=1499966 RepID=A0A0S6W601_9BACT|nr:hypothetical protein U14_04695 [Candidatus Moduliflexus flocculans]